MTHHSADAIAFYIHAFGAVKISRLDQPIGHAKIQVGEIRRRAARASG